MKITFGRKFLGCVIATLLLGAVFFVTLFIRPEAITAAVVIAYGSLNIMIWFAYIGGNVWNKYIQKKGG